MQDDAKRDVGIGSTSPTHEDEPYPIGSVYASQSTLMFMGQWDPRFLVQNQGS